LLTVVGAFLTAPGRHRRRRIVAVALLAALLHALRQAANALAAGPRRQPRSRPSAGTWMPASWAAVGLTALVGFALGSGVTTVRGGWSEKGGTAATNGGATVTIPDVRGMTVSVARRTLLAERLQVSLWAKRANAPIGIALRTQPRGGSKASEGSPVRLIASSGPRGEAGPSSTLDPGWWKGNGPGGRGRGEGPGKVEIPPVEGLTRRAAMTILREAGLDPTASSSEQSELIAKGLAIRTEPGAGRQVREGLEVSLVISIGPPATDIEIPDVSGMPSKTAIAEIRAAGLSVEVVPEESESPVDTVIGTDPAAHEHVPAGSVVDVFVSSGIAQKDSTPEDRDPYGLDPDESE
jgi:serine/threonine-protein kinase